MNFAPNVARAMAHMLEDRLPGRAEELAVAADIAPPLAQGEDAWMDVLVRADANGALRLAAALTRAAPADAVVGQVRRELDGTRERLRRAALGVAVMGFGVAAGMLLFQGEPPRRPVADTPAAVNEIAPAGDAPAGVGGGVAGGIPAAPASSTAPTAAVGPAPAPAVAPAPSPTTSFGPAAPAPAAPASTAAAPARVVYGPALPPDWKPAIPQVPVAPPAPVWAPPPVAWTPPPAALPVAAPAAAVMAAPVAPTAPAPTAAPAPAPAAAPTVPPTP